eukprot:Gb_07755 [translate_table: standard]
MPRTQGLYNDKHKMMFLFLSSTKRTFTSTFTSNINGTISGVKGEQPKGNVDANASISSENVRLLCNEAQLQKAHRIIRGFNQVDSYTYVSFLQTCVNTIALAEGRVVHAHIIQTGFNRDIYVETKLLILYAKYGRLADARRILDDMPKRNVVSWTAMISAYARHGYGEEALTLFIKMQRTGIQPDQVTFVSVVPALSSLAALAYGKEIHEYIIRSGYQSDVFVGSALVDMYAKCASLQDARHVFDKMPERNVVSWNAMIAGYAQNGFCDEAVKLFQQMQLRGMKPNSVTFASVLPACGNSATLQQGKEVHEDIIRSGVEFNVFVGSALVDMYAKCRSVEDARNVFDRLPYIDVVSWNAMITGYALNEHVYEALMIFHKMPKRNVVSWNSMIAGFAQNGRFDEALKLFRQMQLAGLKPNSVTFASVLPACANLAGLIQGKEIHEDMIRSGFHPNVFLENTLVDMYAKCGSIEDARKVFSKMPEQNVVSWNTMILGYAMHGCGKVALDLFEQMQHSGMKPDHITFVGVLSACCHTGLVDDGWQIFDCMSQDYQITPAVEHYCCMVDLLGRAGRVREAHDFISKMPIKPNVAVWGSLLGACRIHSNIEIGEHAAEHLFKLDTENSAHYVQLSNMYAAAGRWDDKEKVRKVMKDKKLKKALGCSWIEEAGYLLDMKVMLQDVEQQEKEQILCHPRKKLGIASGPVNTSTWYTYVDLQERLSVW